jgi:hypothetical protein
MEQQASGVGAAAVEAEGELVEVVVEMPALFALRRPTISSTKAR